MIEKYNYSPFEQAKVYEIFAKHNITFEYESLEDSQKALNEILYVTLQSYKRNFVKYSYNALYYEHSLDLQQISGYVKVFPYLNLMMFDDDIVEKVGELLTILRVYNYPPVDLMEWFSVGYTTKKSIAEYTFSSFCPLHDTDIHTVDDIFTNIGYEETKFQRRFRAKSTYCVLSRLTYTPTMKLKRYGYLIDPSIFLEDDVMSRYESYVGFYEFIQDKVTAFRYLDVIFDVNYENYICLEFATHDTECLDDLIECGLVTETQKDYITNSKKTAAAENNFLVKVEWIDADNVNVMWYNKQ
tara:strand:- start:367 stop:1263 length:897 start_codon:yes stop_codon:yes gene_type:complete